MKALRVFTIGAAVVPHRGAFVRQPVWVQGFWGWNGFTWVWVPG